MLLSHLLLVRVVRTGTEITDFTRRVLIYLLTEVKHREGNHKCHSNEFKLQARNPTHVFGEHLGLLPSPQGITCISPCARCYSSFPCFEFITLDQEKESKCNYVQGTDFQKATLRAMLVFRA